jgi:hypothetical protein
MERDPGARVAILLRSLRGARARSRGLVALALESLTRHPDALRCSGYARFALERWYGWIVAEREPPILRPIERFATPRRSRERAVRPRRLDSCLFAARAASLVGASSIASPGCSRASLGFVSGGGREQRLDESTGRSATTDFRAASSRAPRRLFLEVVPSCGWTDLGTPGRVEACLAMLWEGAGVARGCFPARGHPTSRIRMSRAAATADEPYSLDPRLSSANTTQCPCACRGRRVLGLACGGSPRVARGSPPAWARHSSGARLDAKAAVLGSSARDVHLRRRRARLLEEAAADAHLLRGAGSRA